ncbi:hypothetical protein ABVT39_025623 [Epinephelus coioides]
MKEGVLTPIEMVIKQHPSRAKRIQRCVAKWHKRTSGKNRWPMDGTFNLACCDEVESELRHVEARDTKESYKLKNKRAKEREVLGWFRQTGTRIMVQLEERDKEHQTQEEVTPTAPPPPTLPPPPYLQEPTQPAMGQYPLRGSKATEMEGQLEGRFTVTLTKNNEQRPKRRGLQRPRRKLKLETEPSSETESTDGSTSDEEDGEFTEMRDTTDSASDAGSRSAEGQAPTAGRKDRGRQKQVKNKSKAHHKSCSSLPTERSGSPIIELHKKKGKIEELKPRPMTTFDYEHWQQMLEWEAKNRQMREAEERQRPATISPPPYPDPPTERGPHNESDHSLQDHTPRGASLIDARGQELLKELEGISRKTEGRLQQMSQLLETIQEQQLKEEGLQQEPEEPRASPTTEHITLTLQGTMKSNKTQAKEVRDTNRRPTTDNRAQSQGGMRLRGGKVLGETEDVIYLYDDEGLAERLPALDGADKWIMALEETTAGIQLALGDVKALLTYVAGKQITQEIFTEANVGAAIGNNYSDDVDFGHYHSKVWRQLRKHYPAKRDPSKLEGKTLGENECPSKFLHTFQKKWKEEKGEAWNANKTTQSLFKMMVKKAMWYVVGLMKMDWPLFSEHIVHHVELYRKDKKRMKKTNN